MFIDLNKAYDRVDRKILWEDMANKMNIPQSLIKLIRNMYVESKGIIPNVADGNFLEFLANIGVK